MCVCGTPLEGVRRRSMGRMALQVLWRRFAEFTPSEGVFEEGSLGTPSEGVGSGM